MQDEKSIIIKEIIGWIHADREREEQDPVNLTEDTPLLDQGIFDSLKILEFVAWLNETYEITIGVDDLTAEFFSSPRSIAEGVLRLLRLRNPSGELATIDLPRACLRK